MSPERNDPCPCGSGKKYKKCCGAVAIEQDPITRNRDIAYAGDIGCSIYEVRPFVCASLVAVTPAEECRWETPGANHAKYYRFGFKIENDMPYFVKPRNPIVFGCMPELVHRILEEGYTFLSSIEGLEGLSR